MTPARYSQRLDSLLQNAADAYRRHDDAAFTAKLEEAIDAAPYRVDLVFDLANHHIQTNNPEKALLLFRALTDRYPRDIDASTCLAHWLRQAGDPDEAEQRRLAIAKLRKSRADDLAAVWRIIDDRLSRPVSGALPTEDDVGTAPAIVVLGFVLAEDGSMRRPLIDRLEKTLEAAKAFPAAPVIVTGGVPRAGMVEAKTMHAWLAERGVDDARIHEEGYARDVVENIVYSRPILDRLNTGAAIVITSAGNVGRAGAAMEIHARMNGSGFSVPDAVAAREDDDAHPKETLKLYRDALRAYGMPMMRTYPHLIEL